MACRECGGATCACSYSAGPGIALSGSGSATDPLIPAVNLGSNSGLYVNGSGLFSQRWRVGTTAERTAATPLSEGDWWDDTTQKRIYRRTSGAWVLVSWYGVPAANQGQPSFRATRATNLSIPNNVITEVTLTTEVVDTDGGFAPTAARYTVPAGLAGVWAGVGKVTWGSAPGTGSFLMFGRNGTRYGSVSNAGDTEAFVSIPPLRYAGGVGISMLAYQITGAAINISAAELELYYLGA